MSQPIPIMSQVCFSAPVGSWPSNVAPGEEKDELKKLKAVARAGKAKRTKPETSEWDDWYAEN